MAKDTKKDAVADDAPEVQVQTREVMVKRMLVIQTDGAKVDLLANAMFLLEAKAALEMVHGEICKQINQTAARPQGVPPAKDLLDEGAVVDTEQEGAKEEVATG